MTPQPRVRLHSPRTVTPANAGVQGVTRRARPQVCMANLMVITCLGIFASVCTAENPQPVRTLLDSGVRRSDVTDQADSGVRRSDVTDQADSGVRRSEATEKADSVGPLFGFTPFPYDLTLSAIQKSREIVAEHGNIYALHFDNGIPWAEALTDSPFPQKLRDEWHAERRAMPAGMPVYLGLAPLAQDRTTLAAPSEGSSVPAAIKNAALDSDVVKQAFYNYASRAIAQFEPQFVNLGIEAGELAGRDASRWAQFVRLYEFVYTRLKKDRPHLKIGISFGLHSLMESRVADLARLILGHCDYLGVSFHPFMSQLHEKLGCRKLPDPPEQWTKPLDWLRGYSELPLAICETTYTTRDVSVPKHRLRLSGNPQLQARYVRDLGRIAHRDDYLFVVWFLAVDYDELYKKLPEGDGVNAIWRHTGLLDMNLNPKPAWDEWNKLVRRSETTSTGAADEPSPREHGSNGRTPANVSLGFRDQSELFVGSPFDSFTLLEAGAESDVPAMKWRYAYQPGRWQWGTRELKPGTLAGVERMTLRVRSDRAGPVFVQLEESTGETHFLILLVSDAWEQVEVDLKDFNVDPQKRRDGRLQIDDVRQILVADNAAESGEVEGARSVWFADWRFEPAPAGRR